MESFITNTKTKIWGTKNSWSLTPRFENDTFTDECYVVLEIQGTMRQGYNLVMSPEGFFTADTWYSSKQDALDEAKELFGVQENEWVINTVQHLSK